MSVYSEVSQTVFRGAYSQVSMHIITALLVFGPFFTVIYCFVLWLDFLVYPASKEIRSVHIILPSHPHNHPEK